MPWDHSVASYEGCTQAINSLCERPNQKGIKGGGEIRGCWRWMLSAPSSGLWMVVVPVQTEHKQHKTRVKPNLGNIFVTSWKKHTNVQVLMIKLLQNIYWIYNAMYSHTTTTKLWVACDAFTAELLPGNRQDVKLALWTVINEASLQ